MSEEIIGHSAAELAASLNAIEAALNVGESIGLQVCTEVLPTDEQLAEVYLNAVAAGFDCSMPTATMVGGIAVTQISLTKTEPDPRYTGHPQWQLLVPILAIIAVPALIAFGIVKIGDISSAVMPILLAAGGILILTVVLLRKPAENVAVKYIERGGKVPLLPAVSKKYLSTSPPSSIEEKGAKYIIHMTMKSRREADEEARDLRDHGNKTKVVPWEGGFAIYHHPSVEPRELQEKVRGLWKKMCEWEGIPVDSKFVVFSADNPFHKEYEEAIGKLLRFQQFKHGEFRPATVGKVKKRDRKPTRDDVEIDVWEERDRLHIRAKNKRTGKTIAEWWDDDARQMFEDGFFERGVIHRQLDQIASPKLENSILKYLEDMGNLSRERYASTYRASTIPIESSDPKELAVR